MSIGDYQKAQCNSITKDVDIFFKNLDNQKRKIKVKDLFTINKWINIAKNNDFTESLFDLLKNYEYDIDFSNFNVNIEYFSIYNKEGEDYLISNNSKSFDYEEDDDEKYRKHFFENCDCHYGRDKCKYKLYNEEDNEEDEECSY